MSARDRSELEEEAIAWVVRTRDPGFADWEGFTAWLEQDAAHTLLYDALMHADEAIADEIARAPAVPVQAAAPSRSRYWYGGAVAASVAAVGALLLTNIDRNPFPTQEYRTGPGERSSVQLADGSRADLNGSTRLVVDGPRHARLEDGEALFTVVHDSSHPFEVASAGAVIRDVGTVFDIVRSPRTFTVTVSEGAIVFNPDREKVHVPAGKSIAQEGDRLVIRSAGAGEAGGWREGRLTYQGAPLVRVAEDLSRSLGLAVAADPALARRPFSGIIQIDSKGEPALRAAAATIGVRLLRSGEGWLLTD